MKLSVDSGNLISATSFVSQITAKNIPMKFATCVHLRADGDALALRTCNSELSCRGSVPADVSAPGGAVVPMKAFASAIKVKGQQRIILESDDDSLRVSTDEDVFELATESADIFPSDDHSDTDYKFVSVQGAHWADAIKSVAFACGVFGGVFGGVFVEVDGDKLNVASTDSRRLSLFGIPISSKDNGFQGGHALIPLKAALASTKVATRDDGVLLVGFSESSFSVSDGSLSISGSQLSGRFPDYRQVIPDTNTMGINLDVPRAELLRVLKRSMLLSGDAGVVLTLRDGEIEVARRNADVGGYQGFVECKNLKGGSLRVGFNPRYLADFLGVSTASRVTAHLNDDRSAAVFEDKAGRCYVLMPLTMEE